MKTTDYIAAMAERGITVRQNWSTTHGDFPFILTGCRAHGPDGAYLGLVILQQMLDPEGKPDGLVVYVETQGNDLDADAIAILEMKK